MDEQQRQSQNLRVVKRIEFRQQRYTSRMRTAQHCSQKP
ncbi:putative translation initiation factor IF-2 [Lyngbya aestuarii BL J]|uniref:Putative translation initiation factor IF-2 n=1 Tax=Lyngbya aestuarii BL J TaxID=1348334 RepID=U7QAT2_9CYAN|nr:putative translation initiation factor IF-2 [Lyngbya aestuarii BL J]